MIYIVSGRKKYKDIDLIADIGTVLVNKDKSTPFTDMQFNDDDIILPMMWGEIQGGGILINSNEARKQAIDKGNARRILAANGLPVPRTWFDINKSTIPYIARPQSHYLGNNFHVVRNRRQHIRMKNKVKKGWYFQEIFEFDREYRVIVFGDEVICSFRKDIPGLTFEEMVRERKERRRNRDTNEAPRSELRVEDITDEQKDICIRASRAMGLHFSGVDVAMRGDDMIIFEVNITPVIRGFYSEQLKEKIINFKKQ